jgi:enoyl-CoA hydratase/carnithine racemase
LIVARESGLVRVTLNAPDRRNVLSAGDCAELAAILRESTGGVVLIEAEGSFFCGGLEAGAEAAGLFEPWPWRGTTVAAAVQGPAVDEGVALLACAHVVVAAQGSSFALTAMRGGVFPEVAYRALSRAIGERRALEVALTARVFSTQEALAWGLVHQVAPPVELEDRVEALVGALRKPLQPARS